MINQLVYLFLFIRLDIWYIQQLGVVVLPCWCLDNPRWGPHGRRPLLQEQEVPRERRQVSPVEAVYSGWQYAHSGAESFQPSSFEEP